ncbi:putative 2-oxoglutarate-dependent dioxygenase DIN11 [Vanrija pseudolonga]|uniref:2-oxoglutarate-dependent dioxygenase DIN11 n=1 Tax=Vanrija pseudolonga TaxID=143232 RepID=A0AAF0Y9A8_9TREE|nr:putative 2-oxoglutarate-dependent dioxygenase DIN11 [Vanrija pseudolonga]
MPAAALPILDLALLSQGEAASQRFRDELTRVTHEVGFFYLVNSGLSADLQQRMLATTRAFFALPDEQKLAIHNVKSRHFRGYTRLGAEQTYGRPDWREQVDMAPERDPIPEEPVYNLLVGPNQWPKALPQLRAVCEEWQAVLYDVSYKLLRAWAQSLGAGADYFDGPFADPFHHMKIVRYPGAARANTQGVGTHTDSGFLTLLWIEEGKGGLQVQLRDGSWIDAPPLKDALVVNIGEMLQVWAGGYLRATPHRVVSPLAPDDRVSVPFFFNPSLDTTFPPFSLPSELAAKAREKVVADDPRNPLFELYGWNALKARLKSHPDVAEAHHAELVKQGVAGADVRIVSEDTGVPAEI